MRRHDAVVFGSAPEGGKGFRGGSAVPCRKRAAPAAFKGGDLPEAPGGGSFFAKEPPP
jgi:hypothetical protein